VLIPRVSGEINDWSTKLHKIARATHEIEHPTTTTTTTNDKKKSIVNDSHLSNVSATTEG